MKEFPVLFPDPALLAALQPEELGAKILFLLRKRVETAENNDTQGKFNLNNELIVPWPHYTNTSAPWAEVSSTLRAEVEVAITEAWTWLRAQGLLIPAPGTNGTWEILSRRARAFEAIENFQNFATARLLPREILHPLLAERVWLAFMRADFDSAVFHAMKTVEVRVRSASGLGNDLVGVDLMRKAFEVNKGPLTDQAAERGEREACSNLFAGAIGSYKNPQSHREVSLSDPARALEVVLLANHLLCLVDIRSKQVKQDAGDCV